MMKLPGYLIVASIALAGTATAAPLLSENFDLYTQGNLAGQGGWTLNNAGTAVVSASAHAFSSPNVMSLGGGGAVQHNYSTLNLGLQASTLSFQFLSNTTTAGRNIQLSLRTGTSGAESVLYVNLLGAGTGLLLGTSAGTTSNYTFSNPLAADTWYTFSATTSPTTQTLAFSVTPANGGGVLTSGTLSLAATSLATQRIVFSSNSSTTSGDWLVDDVRLDAIPEPGTIGLALGGAALLALYRRARRGNRSYSAR